MKGLGVNGEDESNEAVLLWGAPSDSDQHQSRQRKRLPFWANVHGFRCCFGITATIIALVCMDVANYTAINPLFGTLEDFKRLLSAAHRKGIKLLMDFVPNHTSDEHAWFKESSLTNPTRNWYIWASPSNYSSDGKPVPPNNWYSVFGGSMWEYDETTKQYYLHQFTVQQPDLNFRNPDVLDALDDNLRFWLDLGVDGFHADAIAHLFEDPLLRNEALYPNQTEISYNSFYHNYTKDPYDVEQLYTCWFYNSRCKSLAASPL